MHFFALARDLTGNEILTFEILDLEKVSQDQFSQWRHLMKIYKHLILHFRFWQDTTCANKGNAETQRNGQGHDYMRNCRFALKRERERAEEDEDEEEEEG